MGHSQFAELIGARGPEHADQRRLREHDAGGRGRGGLDPRRALPAGADRDRRRRRHLRRRCSAGSAPASWPRARRRPTRWSRTRRCRSTGAVTACSSAWAPPALVVESAEAARERGVHADLRGARRRSPPTAPSTARGSTSSTSARSWSSSWRRPRARRRARGTEIAAETGVRLARDLHARPRRQRRGGDPRAARRLRRATPTASSSPTPRASPGTRWASGSRTSSAVKALETGVVPPVPNFRDVDPDARRRSTCRRAASYPVRYALRLAAGLRLADRDAAAALDARRRRPQRRNPEELGFDYRIADRAAWDAWLRARQRPRRPAARGRAAPAARRRPGARRRAGRSAPLAAAAPAAARRARAGARGARAAPAPAPQPRRRPPATIRRAAVLAIVAEQTGYPTDLLDLDLDLEADLGHRHRQAGRGVRHHPRGLRASSATTTLKLRDYPTLNHVVGFVHERTGAPAPAPAAAPPRPPAAPAPDAGRRRRRRRAARPARSSPSRPATRPTCSTSTSTSRPTSGIDTVKQAEVFATIREAYGHRARRHLKLRDYPTLNHVVGFVRDAHRARPAPAPAARAAPPAEPAPAARRRRDRRAAVLEVVAEQTGYPHRPARHGPRPRGRPRASTPSSRPRSSPPSARPTGIHRDDNAQAARLPDPQPRRPLRPRPHRRARAPAHRTPRRAAARPTRRRPTRTPTRRSPAACRSRSCARRSTAAWRPACGSARARASS